MPIVGHGVDIVEVGRIARMAAEHGDHFVSRCFTPAEAAYSDSGKRRDEHLAGRFAAKEAVLKALGTGWRNGIAWTDVEVVLLPSGQPTVRLHGAAASAAGEQGITRWLLSISHTAQYACASAIGTND